MKKLLILALIATLLYGGYLYYDMKSYSEDVPTTSEEYPGQLIITDASNNLGHIASVLGANVSNIFEEGKEILSDATSGASEPIINKLVEKTQETLKDLPKKEAEKIKYEFCKDVITEYENN